MRYLLFLLAFCSAVDMHAQQLFWFVDHSLCGFKDAKGKTIIKPQFPLAEPFSEGLAAAGKGNNIPTALYGFINPKGEWVIQPQFNAPGSFSEGLANVQQGGKWGYIDKSGKWVIQPQFQLCYGFVNGYAQVEKKGKWGIIDKKGNFVIQPDYYDVTNVGDGVLGVKKEIATPWNIIDLKGVKQSPVTFGKIKAFNGGKAPARDQNDKYGFVSTKGAWVIKPQYMGAEAFSEGLAAVQNENADWGFIDQSGKMAIKPTFSSAGFFKNGIAMVEKGNEYMYINKKGEILLRFNK